METGWQQNRMFIAPMGTVRAGGIDSICDKCLEGNFLGIFLQSRPLQPCL